MLLFRITYTGHDGVVTNEWVGSWEEAQRLARTLRKRPDTDVRIEQLEVPTDKYGLLEWLNTESNTPKYTEEFYS